MMADILDNLMVSIVLFFPFLCHLVVAVIEPVRVCDIVRMRWKLGWRHSATFVFLAAHRRIVFRSCPTPLAHTECINCCSHCRRTWKRRVLFRRCHCSCARQCVCQIADTKIRLFSYLPQEEQHKWRMLLATVSHVQNLENGVSRNVVFPSAFDRKFVILLGVLRHQWWSPLILASVYSSCDRSDMDFHVAVHQSRIVYMDAFNINTHP